MDSHSLIELALARYSKKLASLLGKDQT